LECKLVPSVENTASFNITGNDKKPKSMDLKSREETVQRIKEWKLLERSIIMVKIMGSMETEKIFIQ
jgi:hypothetical protein